MKYPSSFLIPTESFLSLISFVHELAVVVTVVGWLEYTDYYA
jgi:hypothetical protein